MKEEPREPARCRELLGDLFDGTLSADGRRDLNELLKTDPGARRYYREQARLHADLDLAYAGGGIPLGMPPARETEGSWARAQATGFGQGAVWKLAASVAVLLGLFFAFAIRDRDSVATLVSSEDAAWESELPTALNSRLKPGSLELKQGMATVRFDSGAAVTLEAPARLEILSPMRGRLARGAAIVEAPGSAAGFVMETPSSYAVDHGTKFAIEVSATGQESGFEVLSGEISVHHPGSKQEQRLRKNEAATATERGIVRTESPFTGQYTRATVPALRIGTGGRTQSIIRSGSPTALNPAYLLLKSTVEPENPSERRAFLSFDLSSVRADAFAAARLVFSMVPTGHGLAVHLPSEIRFQVYGIPDAQTPEWGRAWKWEDCPAVSDGQLLGTVTVPRTQQKGKVTIGGDALLEFLKKNQGGPVLFMVVRETKALSSGSLVHAFATDFHPDASGPALEFFLSPEIL